jgi:hypothetical protein
MKTKAQRRRQICVELCYQSLTLWFVVLNVYFRFCILSDGGNIHSLNLLLLLIPKW